MPLKPQRQRTSPADQCRARVPAGSATKAQCARTPQTTGGTCGKPLARRGAGPCLYARHTGTYCSRHCSGRGAQPPASLSPGRCMLGSSASAFESLRRHAHTHTQRGDRRGMAALAMTCPPLHPLGAKRIGTGPLGSCKRTHQQTSRCGSPGGHMARQHGRPAKRKSRPTTPAPCIHHHHHHPAPHTTHKTGQRNRRRIR